jgi:hypothetical protein
LRRITSYKKLKTIAVTTEIDAQKRKISKKASFCLGGAEPHRHEIESSRHHSSLSHQSSAKKKKKISVLLLLLLL